jgi:alcohol dehydrogenase class IV
MTAVACRHHKDPKRSGICSYPRTQRIIYGSPFAQALGTELKAVGTQRVSEALGDPDKPACELVAELVAQLGLPSTLREVGVQAEMLELIAHNAMQDRLIHTNPRKIHGPEDVHRILDAAW